MMSLGRPVEAETLEQRIARRLNEAFDRQVAGGFYPGGENGGRGVIDEGDPDADYDVWPPVRLSIEDVSRIAAREARSWF